MTFETFQASITLITLYISFYITSTKALWKSYDTVTTNAASHIPVNRELKPEV